jgi:hypothetical protein
MCLFRLSEEYTDWYLSCNILDLLLNLRPRRNSRLQMESKIAAAITPLKRSND